MMKPSAVLRVAKGHYENGLSAGKSILEASEFNMALVEAPWAFLKRSGMNFDRAIALAEAEEK